jgi:tetratricopeptide (TPR) repeat protein
VIPNRPLTKEQVSALYDIIVSTSDPDRMTKLQEVAESGNIYAMNSVGLCCKYGHGVKKNLKEAVKWYQKAADAGNADAMLNLGCCFEKGEGLKKNLKEAMKLYEKAAEQGIARAMANLGNLYTVEGQKKNDYTEYTGSVNIFLKEPDSKFAGLFAFFLVYTFGA